MKRLFIFIIFFIFIMFIYGWFMPEKYNIIEGESHMLGLKFVPPCTPSGINATCGYDLFFIFIIIIIFFIFYII